MTRYMGGPYKARYVGARDKNGKYTYRSLQLPRSLWESVPEGAMFMPELCEDGILYRFVGVEQEEPPQNLPSWAKTS